MELNASELNLVRQWFEALTDLSPMYHNPVDHNLYQRILGAIKRPQMNLAERKPTPAPLYTITMSVPLVLTPQGVIYDRYEISTCCAEADIPKISENLRNIVLKAYGAP